MKTAAIITQAKWQLFRMLESLSLLSKVGLFFILITSLAYSFTYLPLTHKLASLQQYSTEQHHPIQPKADPDVEVNRYIDTFPSFTTRASKLNELVAIAKQQQLLLNEVTYKTESNLQQPLSHYQVELSVLASYAEIHLFLNTVLKKMPFVAIESLNLNRTSALDEAVEARIQLTFFFKRT
ncbi:hypothetical protein [Methylotenera versatilis]|uniref:Transmembrane protein n=1 Tax=Methylotenera versatilis (strain 301) TaxID=666681 RepID=D7DJ66_METV0|nr:hypothetical protein [Methylotenera versatilis]ADI30101.1 hypothetical protein M301_1721 [Methylotenera versatilis 301]